MVERLTEKILDKKTGKVLAYEVKPGVKNLRAIQKLGEYETAEEEGRLLTLPCKPGNIVYVIIPSYTTCSKYGYVFDEYSCIRCEEYEKECDSYLEYCIWENKYTTLRWIIGSLERFGKTVFINREEAEKTLEEMNKDIGTNQRTNNYRTS